MKYQLGLLGGGRVGWLALLLSAPIGFACGGESGTTPEGEPSPPPPMMGWGNASVLGGGGVLRYAFTMDPSALAQLITTATAERYLPAELSVSGEEVGTVGLRFKGADGTLDPCFENGRQVCPKVSFKVRFDFADPAKRFHAVQRLNFHSMIDDPSLMHERLNAKLFADMGIVAPRAAHAELVINGENKGVFAVVEDVDRSFLQDHFMPGGNGNLYKEVWPLEIDPDAYDHALEAAGAQRDNSGMVAFAQALQGAGAGELAGVINHFTDIDYLIRYLAVDRAISNYDGITGFYCNAAGHECSNHNYYWYQAEGQQRFWLIPWDLGDSLALHTPLDPVPDWDRPPDDCTLRFRVEGQVLMPSGCDPVIRGLREAGRGPYLNALNRLLGVWDTAALHRQIESWGIEIQDAVARDTTMPGLAGWQAAVRALKRDLVALRERLEKTRDGMTAGTFGLVAPGLTDFESTTPLAFLMTTSSESNAASGAVHDLNRGNAIAGKADARFDFELRNDSNQAAGAYSQWAVMSLPLERPAALGGLRRIRVRVVADTIRSVRIDSASPNYADPEGDRYGWQVLAGRNPEVHVLDVRALALPDETRMGPVPIPGILSAVSGLHVSPEPRGRSEAGLLPAGKADVGFIQIDDISIEIE